MKDMNTLAPPQTVFYSWQSDLPNRTNRTFIQNALEKAIDGVLETELQLDLILDRDTQDTPGAPDIAQTILGKIDQSVVVVADVSIINAGTDVRLTPNPNVLFELGYAVRVLSWDYVLPVFNLATGHIEDLPFDLRPRRPITYTMTEDITDRGPELKKLARTLQSALQLIIVKHKEKTPNVQLVLQRAPLRFGIRNNGATAIEVVKFTFEFPKSIEVNSGWPMGHPPILRVDEGRDADGTAIWRMTLIKTDAPIAPGYPDVWRLPPRIDPGETEIFVYPAFGFKAGSPIDSVITAKVSLSQGNPLIVKTTLGELLDLKGRFAI
jgi:hypothetical protein